MNAHEITSRLRSAFTHHIPATMSVATSLLLFIILSFFDEALYTWFQDTLQTQSEESLHHGKRSIMLGLVLWSGIAAGIWGTFSKLSDPNQKTTEGRTTIAVIFPFLKTAIHISVALIGAQAFLGERVVLAPKGQSPGAVFIIVVLSVMILCIAEIFMSVNLTAQDPIQRAKKSGKRTYKMNGRTYEAPLTVTKDTSTLRKELMQDLLLSYYFFIIYTAGFATMLTRTKAPQSIVEYFAMLFLFFIYVLPTRSVYFLTEAHWPPLDRTLFWLSTACSVWYGVFTIYPIPFFN